MKTKILVGLITILLAFTIFPIQNVDAATHQNGSVDHLTYSGIDTRGYQWIVLESDDWGLGGFNCLANATEMANYYADDGLPTPTYFACTTLESTSDLDDYYAIIADHPGVVINSQFVMEIMNASAMQANGFTSWVGVPINKTNFQEFTKYNSSGLNYRGDLQAKWLEGYERGLWLPQYHGRSHSNIDWLLQNCSAGCATTINLILKYAETPHRYSWTEYENNAVQGGGNKSIAFCQENIDIGTAEFYNLFGYWPETSTMPSYGGSNNTLAAFRNSTIYGINAGSGEVYLNSTGVSKNSGWKMFDYYNGISIVGTTDDVTFWTPWIRSILFDPVYFPGGFFNYTFKIGQPAIIKDHKTPYTSGILDTTTPGTRLQNLAYLDWMLTRLGQLFPNAWYLTDPELHQLNIRGYSVQNWTDKIVVRNALSQRSITVHIPSHFDIRYLSVKDSNGHARSYISNEAGRTISITVPHNETFTIKQGSIPAIRHFMTDDAPYFTDLIPFFMLIVIIFTACVAIFAFFRRGG